MEKTGKRIRLTPEEVELVYEHRADNTNLNGNTALDIHLEERGINKKDVVSVKHWQSASGEWRFSVVTKQDLNLNQDDVLDKISNFIDKHSPYYPPAQKRKAHADNLLVINPADIHIGKYANDLETGDGYDVETACMRVLEGLEGLLAKAEGYDVERILFCIGNDVLHVDNVYNTTTKGTHQDTDGKWWEHFEVALALYVKCVEILREVAPVDIIHSMSNHDYQSGFHLAHALKSWFRKDKDLSFDISVTHRKYYKYGSNLIGIEHGDGAKMDKLPLLMAQEKPKMWGDTNFC